MLQSPTPPHVPCFMYHVPRTMYYVYYVLWCRVQRGLAGRQGIDIRHIQGGMEGVREAHHRNNVTQTYTGLITYHHPHRYV